LSTSASFSNDAVNSMVELSLVQCGSVAPCLKWVTCVASPPCISNIHSCGSALRLDWKTILVPSGDILGWLFLSLPTVHCLEKLSVNDCSTICDSYSLSSLICVLTNEYILPSGVCLGSLNSEMFDKSFAVKARFDIVFFPFLIELYTV